MHPTQRNKSTRKSKTSTRHEGQGAHVTATAVVPQGMTPSTVTAELNTPLTTTRARTPTTTAVAQVYNQPPVGARRHLSLSDHTEQCSRGSGRVWLKNTSPAPTTTSTCKVGTSKARPDGTCLASAHASKQSLLDNHKKHETKSYQKQRQDGHTSHQHQEEPQRKRRTPPCGVRRWARTSRGQSRRWYEYQRWPDNPLPKKKIPEEGSGHCDQATDGGCLVTVDDQLAHNHVGGRSTMRNAFTSGWSRRSSGSQSPCR